MTTGGQMILICYDGSDDAKAAIDQAGKLLGGQPATVLTVWQPFAELLAETPLGFGIAPGRLRASYEQAIQLGAAWLLKQQPKGNEDRVGRLTGLVWSGKYKDAAQKALLEKPELATQIVSAIMAKRAGAEVPPRVQ